MDMTEKTLKQDYKFRGRIVNMRVDEALMPDGTTASREVVEHNGGVCVAPLTDDGGADLRKTVSLPIFRGAFGAAGR